MEREENVYEETTLTEEFAEAKENGASTVLGKFKDVSALERAYESLQAEFTRRSQKLRELEREVENFKKEQAQSGVEKLRKNAKARREAAKEFDAFIADMGAAFAKDKKPTEASLDEDVPKEKNAETNVFAGEERLEKEQVRAETEKGKPSKDAEQEKTAPAFEESGKGEKLSFEKESESARFSADELFERAVNDEAVRLRIVGEYLTSLGKSGAPLTAAGAGMLATPQINAKTVGEAGDMALLYFRKPVV